MKYLKDNYNEDVMKKKFNESYAIMCKLNEPFHEKMKKIYEHKSINKESEFMKRTELGKGVYRKFVTKGYIPSMKTFMSMCMGLNLDLPSAESLLASLSLGFEKTEAAALGKGIKARKGFSPEARCLPGLSGGKADIDPW